MFVHPTVFWVWLGVTVYFLQQKWSHTWSKNTSTSVESNNLHIAFKEWEHVSKLCNSVYSKPLELQYHGTTVLECSAASLKNNGVIIAAHLQLSVGWNMTFNYSQLEIHMKTFTMLCQTPRVSMIFCWTALLIIISTSKSLWVPPFGSHFCGK